MNTKYLASINSCLIILFASFLLCTTLQAADSSTPYIHIEEAIEANNPSLVKGALTKNQNISSEDQNDILNYIASPEREEEHKETLVDILKLLLNRCPNLLTEKGKADKILRRICQSNNGDLVDILLNSKKDYSKEALEEAAFSCAEEDKHNSLKVLIESSLLKFPLKNENNNSILIVASNSKSVNVVKVLLESKKEIEINYQHEKPKESSKTTALMEASNVDDDENITKSLSIVQLLLKNNANPNLLNASHQGAFTNAITKKPRSGIARAILAHDQFDWKVKYNNSTILHRVIQKLEGAKKVKEKYTNSTNNGYKNFIPNLTLDIKELESLLKMILDKNIVDPQAVNKKGKKAIELTQDENIQKQLKEAEEKYKKAHPNQGGKPKFNIFKSKGAKIAGVVILIIVSLGAMAGIGFFIMKKKSKNE